MPKFTRQIILCLVLFFCLAASAKAATYYVATNGNNANSCSQTSPCLTIVKGVSMMQGGDTLKIRRGIYDEKVSADDGIHIPSGLSVSQRTVITVDTGAVVTIKPTTPGGIILISERKFIELGGFTIDGALQPETTLHNNGVFTDGSTMSAVEGMYFHDLVVQNISEECINGNGTNMLFQRNTMKNCGKRNPTICPSCGRGHAIYARYNNSIIENNTIDTAGGYGYHVHCSPPSCASLGVNNNVIRFNKASNTGSPGMYVGCGNNNIAYGNILDHNGLGGSANLLMCSSGGIAYNNTVTNGGGIGILAIFGGNKTIKNNLVVGNADNRILLDNENDGVYDPPVGTVLANNMTAGTVATHFVGATTGNLHLLSSSSAINAGVTLSSPYDKDFDGVFRPQESAYDIGAYEYVSGSVSPTPTPTPTPSPTTSATTPCANTVPYEGFGASTPGGSGKPVYHVSNLNDSGAGSFRDAVSQGNRCVLFDVAGNINLASQVTMQGSFITIDGFSAPSPGITLKGRGIRLSGNYGVHDVIVRGLKIRIEGTVGTTNDDTDGIGVEYGAYNIVVDHNSISGAVDENIGIAVDVHDVTISWNIIAAAQGATWQGGGFNRNLLVHARSKRFSVHHNLMTEATDRNPWFKYDNPLDSGGNTTAPEIMADIRNNLIMVQYGGYGTMISDGAKANVINNYYGILPNGKTDQAILVCPQPFPNPNTGLQFCVDNAAPALAYVSGNIAVPAPAVPVDAWSKVSTPFSTAPVTTTDACVAAGQVYAKAGARNSAFALDARDQDFLSRISLGSCASVSFPTPPPTGGCTNPSPIPSGFSAPCPVFGISPASGSASQNFSASITPDASKTVWIYKTLYITEGSTWKAITLPGTVQYTYWLQGNISYAFTPSSQSLTPGVHYLASWDWTWDATAQCYKGPGATACGGGQYRIQRITIQ